MATYAELQASIDRFIATEAKQYAIVQGAENETVATAAGSVPTYLEHQRALAATFANSLSGLETAWNASLVAKEQAYDNSLSGRQTTWDNSLASKENAWDNSAILATVAGHRTAAETAQSEAESAETASEGFRDEAELFKQQAEASAASHVVLTSNNQVESAPISNYTNGVISLMPVSAGGYPAVGLIAVDRRSNDQAHHFRYLYGYDGSIRFQRNTYSGWQTWNKVLFEGGIQDLDIGGLATMGNHDMLNPEALMNVALCDFRYRDNYDTKDGSYVWLDFLPTTVDYSTHKIKDADIPFSTLNAGATWAQGTTDNGHTNGHLVITAPSGATYAGFRIGNNSGATTHRPINLNDWMAARVSFSSLDTGRVYFYAGDVRMGLIPAVSTTNFVFGVEDGTNRNMYIDSGISIALDTFYTIAIRTTGIQGIAWLVQDALGVTIASGVGNTVTDVVAPNVPFSFYQTNRSTLNLMIANNASDVAFPFTVDLVGVRKADNSRVNLPQF